MLLPKNIERCQWVNRYYRIKVLLNVAELNSKLYSAKTQRGIFIKIFIYSYLEFFGAFFRALLFFKRKAAVCRMDTEDGENYRLDSNN